MMFLQPVFRFLSHMNNESEVLVELLSWLIILIGGCILALRFVEIPYGRYSSSKYRFLINGKVAWFVQEIPSLAIPLYLFFSADKPLQPPNMLMLGMFICHYSQRSLIYPFLIRGGKSTPFAIFVMALAFCTCNGYLQAINLTKHAVYSSDWITDPRFLTGSALWFLGLLVNLHSDHILRNLRKPGETGYKIPRGGMFEYVSGANFFGEIVEWMGYAIACWCLPSAAFAIFTFFVVSSRAAHHHRWYLEKFEDYPKTRKILIPFLY
ncbi:3-oxo-5-alpha-steroid 4-dehydrogenase 1 [Pristis pectinata]|uniref:3-oxo-5-alpha-steroid 4-dehydrogenase 1 n=1 Tax=Pristis pectinata TaxID=685728 RepID=UPI00223D3307|nr:3-oxo-5-alpha-steroid 4-dehydrogenase 1 [Pristis pectinata]